MAALPLLLGLSRAADALTPTPFLQPELLLSNTSTVVTYKVDLGTLPARPRLVVEARPDAAHADMTIAVEIGACTVIDTGSGGCLWDPIAMTPLSVVSPATPGPQSIFYDLFRCDLATTYPAYVGQTCDVRVRVASFGTTPGPATIDLAIRGETVVPTSTAQVPVSTAVQSVVIGASRDTTLYQPSPTSSNGLGPLLSSYHLTGTDRRNALLDFDVAAAVPAGAPIVGASLELELTGTSGAPPLELFAVSRDPLSAWIEGSSASPDGFMAPAPGTTPAATWTHRRWNGRSSLAPWTTPGGDLVPPALVRFPVEGRGRVALSSPALLSHVQALHAGSTAFDGLIVTATEGGVQIASRENPSASRRPGLVIQYAPPPTTGIEPTGTVPFFDEGQNFRWIYDTDGDNVLFTPIAGRCEITAFRSTTFDFRYQFQGDPGYVGLDCCTWQIGSWTGVSGVGQAIFFVNASPIDPAYQPGDYDTDGIKDLCDNCPSVPNGPRLGSCMLGSKIGKLCHTHQECGIGGACSLAQDDADRTPPANACVPEPAAAPAIAIGLLCLAGWAGRRARRVDAPVGEEPASAD